MCSGCAVVAVVCDAQEPAGVRSTSAIAAACLPATVTILSINADGDTIGLGSGFIVRQDGVIITNAHVLRGASRAVVILASKERISRVNVMDADSARDVAVLKIPDEGLPFLATRVTIPKIGERVVAIGSPEGLSQTVTEGIVSGTRIDDGRQLVQISAPISPGSSGGAVLDDHGRVFAISTSYLTSGQQLNFALPVRYALGLIEDSRSLHSIAEVFGEMSSTSHTSGTTATALAGAAPATSPRASVSGSYRLQQVVTFSNGKTNTETGLLFATGHVGWLVVASNLNGKLGNANVYGVATWRTAATGAVLLDAGGVAYDGYQTNGGGFVASSIQVYRGDTLRYNIVASPTSIPLSEKFGLFDASVRTTFTNTNGYSSGDVTDWRGDMAVAISADSIRVDLWLTNDAGGTTAMDAVGPITTDGSFAIASNGSRLRGHIQAGRVIADWEDNRDTGRFAGRLDASRK